MPKRRQLLTDEEGEVRGLTREDFRGMRPVGEAMPEIIEAMAELRRKLGRRRPTRPRSISGFRRTSSSASRRAAPAMTPVSSERCARLGFGAKASKKAKMAAKQRTKPAVSNGRTT